MRQKERNGCNIAQLSSEIVSGEKCARALKYLFILVPVFLLALFAVTKDGGIVFMVSLCILVVLLFVSLPLHEESYKWREWVKEFREFEKYFSVHNHTHGPSHVYARGEGIYQFYCRLVDETLKGQAKKAFVLEGEKDLEKRYQHAVERDKFGTMYWVADELGLTIKEMKCYFDFDTEK